MLSQINSLLAELTKVFSGQSPANECVEILDLYGPAAVYTLLSGPETFAVIGGSRIARQHGPGSAVCRSLSKGDKTFIFSIFSLFGLSFTTFITTRVWGGGDSW